MLNKTNRWSYLYWFHKLKWRAPKNVFHSNIHGSEKGRRTDNVSIIPLKFKHNSSKGGRRLNLLLGIDMYALNGGPFFLSMFLSYLSFGAD